MRGHHGSAIAHMQSGIDIIADMQKSETPGRALDAMEALAEPRIPLIPLDALRTHFVRIDSQVCELVGTSGHMILRPAQDRLPGFGPMLPGKFSSIAEARNSFDYLYNNAMHGVNETGRTRCRRGFTLARGDDGRP